MTPKIEFLKIVCSVCNGNRYIPSNVINIMMNHHVLLWNTEIKNPCQKCYQAGYYYEGYPDGIQYVGSNWMDVTPVIRIYCNSKEVMFKMVLLDYKSEEDMLQILPNNIFGV